MASETSELTFVRCPACRSLVPAAATRCRICNNPLESEASGKGDDSDAARNAGRVRQKTITATPDDVATALKSAKGNPAALSGPPLDVAPAASVPVVDNDDDDFDPLSAYLEEIEDFSGDTPSVESPASGAVAGAVAVQPEDDFDFDLFDEPELLAQVAGSDKRLEAAAAVDEASRATSIPAEPPTGKKSVYDVTEQHQEFAFDAADEEPELPVSSKPAVKQPPVAAPAAVREEGRREVSQPQPAHTKKPQQQQVQQPARQQPNNQRSAGSAPAKQQHAPRAQQERRPQQQNQQQNQQQHQRDVQGAQRKEGNRDQQQRYNAGAAQPERRQEDRRQEDRRPEERRAEQSLPPVASERGPKTGKMRPGRLFGWFVSYENPDGRAIELREGKFFVTGSSIRPSDLILEDPSISTPHALMAVSADGGMVIQDLMSDRGIFVRSVSGGGYRREEGTARIEHGDWVRFGDVEFLVIIVPNEGRR
jgi:hypothetical protein